jgi:hypothetical protein
VENRDQPLDSILGAVIYVACFHSRTAFSKEAPTYVYPNFLRQNKSEIWTNESLNNGDYVYIGARHAYERALLEGYTCQLMGSPHSWNKVVDGWNLEAFNSGTDKKRTNWQLRLSFAFIKYKILQFDLCVGAALVSVPCTAQDFDQWAWDTFPRRLTSFIYLWNNHKTLIGPCSDDCSRCLIVDGHQKCRRRVCRAKQVEVVTEEFASLKIGCCRTPKRGSYYCELHRAEHSSEDTSSIAVERRKQSITSWLQRRMNWRQTRYDGLGATHCRTQKARSDDYVQRCSRSFGVIAGVTNCKVIVTFSELFRSETLREIVSLLCSTIRGECVCNFHIAKSPHAPRKEPSEAVLVGRSSSSSLRVNSYSKEVSWHTGVSACLTYSLQVMIRSLFGRTSSID